MNPETLNALSEQQDVRELADECRRILHEIWESRELERSPAADLNGIGGMAYTRGYVIR